MRFLFYFLLSVFTGVFTGVFSLCAQPCFRGGNAGSGQMVFTGDSLANGTRIFLFGELHNLSQLPEMKLAYIKWLHQHARVEDVYMEIGTAAAYLYNRYLATGDTSFISDPALVYHQSAGDKKFWRDLYSWCKTYKVPVVIKGFDFERMEFLKVLRVAASPAGIQEGTRLLRNLDSFRAGNVNSGNLSALLQLFRQDAHQNSRLYRKRFGPGYPLIEGVLNNNCSYSSYRLRDSTMFTNLLDTLVVSGNRKAVIFAGSRHGVANGNNHSFFARILSKFPRPGQVSVIELHGADYKFPGVLPYRPGKNEENLCARSCFFHPTTSPGDSVQVSVFSRPEADQ